MKEMMAHKEKDKSPHPHFMTRRIGNTVYQVKVFMGGGNETMADKLIRIIQNGGLGKRGKIWYGGLTTSQ